MSFKKIINFKNIKNDMDKLYLRITLSQTHIKSERHLLNEHALRS